MAYVWHGKCNVYSRLQITPEDIHMKKVLSSIVATLVAISFAGIVSASEVNTNTKTETTTTSPSGEVKVEKTEVQKTVKKHKKHRKHRHHKKHAESKRSSAVAAPTAPEEAPAAK
jgi:hypothetical protein